MGMLMHHTWQEQQKQKPAVEEKPIEAKAEEPKEEKPATKPVRKAGGRRKTSK